MPAGFCDATKRAFPVTRNPGDPSQQPKILAAARRAGIGHLLVLSSLDTERLIFGDPIGACHRDFEQAVAAAGTLRDWAEARIAAFSLDPNPRRNDHD